MTTIFKFKQSIYYSALLVSRVNHWARRLVRIRAPACGAGRHGFKSHRARH
jgi:hypothetical protein